MARFKISSDWSCRCSDITRTPYARLCCFTAVDNRLRICKSCCSFCRVRCRITHRIDCDPQLVGNFLITPIAQFMQAKHLACRRGTWAIAQRKAPASSAASACCDGSQSLLVDTNSASTTSSCILRLNRFRTRSIARFVASRCNNAVQFRTGCRLETSSPRKTSLDNIRPRRPCFAPDDMRSATRRIPSRRTISSQSIIKAPELHFFSGCL